MNPIRALVDAHRRGERVGVASVCSAHPLVLEATLEHAGRRGAPLALIEATCNQVNPEGGYTGMTPEDFRRFVHAIAERVGFPRERLVLGGDHLGPNPWTGLPAAEAMDRAEAMVRAYVAAGFRKLHLDCSMSCAGDPSPLPEPEIAARAVRLCAAAEDAYAGAPEEAPVYVIGTEVPVPGGAAEALDALAVTDPQAALATVALHRAAFEEAGLSNAWARVVATVVQPGVEFDHDKVVDYRAEAARALSQAILRTEGLVYEAHSTDYQTARALGELVRDHFAILKVGPGVTFALREALWALDAVEREWIAPDRRARLREVTLERMHADPSSWRKYYHASGDRLELQLQYSLSDRVRYYWPDARIAQAQARLFANLERDPPPLGLLSQHLPAACAALREAGAQLSPPALVRAHVALVLDAYHEACHPHG